MWRASLPCSAASRRASSPGTTSSSATSRPSALETTLWATASTSVGRSSPAAAEQRGEVVARAAPRAAPGSASTSSLITPWRPGGAARRACGRPCRGARPARARSAARSAGVSTSRPSDGSSDTLTSAPAARARAAWRANEPAPNDGGMTCGGSSSSALVPLPWRSGTMTTCGGSCRPSSEASSCGSSAGQSPGTSRTRSAPRTSAASIPRTAAADWPASSGSSTTIAPASSAARAASGSAVTTTTSSISGTAASASQHVGHHGGGQLLALAAADRVAEPLLGARERLHGQDRGGAHGAKPNRRAPREGEHVSRHAPARLLVAHLDVGDQRGDRLGALVGDEAVEQAGVVGGDALGAERMAGPGEELVGRALEHGAAHERRDGDDGGAAPARIASRSSARIGPIEITGLEGPITIASARRERLEHLGRRARVLDAAQLDVLDRPGRALADHELLERVPGPARLHVGAHRLVAHRQHARLDAERPARLVDRLGQPGALGEPAGAAHAQREVAVAEVEPDVVAELAQAVHDVEGVAGQAPAALVDAVGEPEGDEVGVGGDVGAVDLDVVGGVGDDDELVRLVEQAARELGSAGPAREQDYHGRSVRPVRRMPACVL